MPKPKLPLLSRPKPRETAFRAENFALLQMQNAAQHRNIWHALCTGMRVTEHGRVLIPCGEILQIGTREMNSPGTEQFSVVK